MMDMIASLEIKLSSLHGRDNRVSRILRVVLKIKRFLFNTGSIAFVRYIGIFINGALLCMFIEDAVKSIILLITFIIQIFCFAISFKKRC